MDPHAQLVLEQFEPLTRIPRPSGKEAAVAAWLEAWARDRGMATRRDAAGNLVIAAPASAGAEGAPTVVIQGHMDMVCERRPDAPRDPARDGVEAVLDGAWLRADGTTLGADNGVAIAMALTALDDPTLVRPPIEVLLTVEEETGLVGALNLDPALLTGRVLLNLDSEDEGTLTVGCAGGRGVRLQLPLAWTPTPDDHVGLRLQVSGLRGGHSGVDIHLQRASANVLLARLLGALVEAGARLAWVEGGSAHNAIARDAHALLTCPPDAVEALTARVASLAEALRAEHAATDPELGVTLEPAPAPAQGLEADAAARSVHLLLALPHGVARVSDAVAGLVQTSNNLAWVRTHRDATRLEVECSQRSSRASELEALCDRVAAIGALAGARATRSRGYPPWEPRMDSPLLALCERVHEATLGAPATVEVMHAGLECGVIGARVPGMDMISFGPTIRDPHSPDERLHMPSVGRCYRFLTALLEALASNQEER